MMLEYFLFLNKEIENCQNLAERACQCNDKFASSSRR